MARRKRHIACGEPERVNTPQTSARHPKINREPSEGGRG